MEWLKVKVISFVVNILLKSAVWPQTAEKIKICAPMSDFTIILVNSYFSLFVSGLTFKDNFGYVKDAASIVQNWSYSEGLS